MDTSKNMMLKAIIIENEEAAQLSLQHMLEKFCKEVKIVAMVNQISDAVRAINQYQPDLVFLDLELPEKNGFALFNYFQQPTFDVIFTSTDTQYAINAIKLSAIDYLLKPFDAEDLKQAVEVAKKKKIFKVTHSQLKILQTNLNSRSKKLVLSTESGYSFIELEQILYCEAQGNYTIFHLKGKEKILVSKTLKLYTDILEKFNFLRVSRSHLININHIKAYGRSKNPSISMIDGAVIPLSISRRNAFLQLLEQSNLN